MSQEKIDKYKEEKANRKKNLAKQKRNAILAKIAGVLVVVLLVVWICHSAYRNHKEQESLEAAQSSFNEWLSEYYATYESSTGENESTKEGETESTKEGETESTKEGETESTGENESSSEESTTPQE